MSAFEGIDVETDCLYVHFPVNAGLLELSKLKFEESVDLVKTKEGI